MVGGVLVSRKQWLQRQFGLHQAGFCKMLDLSISPTIFARTHEVVE
jgi:hypothetical protein